jgi:hypothetical protein
VLHKGSILATAAEESFFFKVTNEQLRKKQINKGRKKKEKRKYTN